MATSLKCASCHCGFDPGVSTSEDPLRFCTVSCQADFRLENEDLDVNYFDSPSNGTSRQEEEVSDDLLEEEGDGDT